MKEFEISQPNEKAPTNYHEKLLHIINGINIQVRAIEPDTGFHNEVHQQKRLDATKEIAEFAEIRADVCESFGVPNDDEHTYIYRGPGDGEQRAFRAFFVLIDALNKKAFYGEGRIGHITLFQKLATMLQKTDPESSFENITGELAKDSMRYLVFKGFLSTKEFAELSESNRKVLETPILDENGEKIETPTSWFITGHSIPGQP